MKVILFLLLPTISFAQNFFSGKIVDKRTGMNIPYATVALIKENIGTNADEKGEFNLAFYKNLLDTLSISCVGFRTSKFSISQIPKNKFFELEAVPATLQSVVIGKSLTKTSSALNDFSNCGNISFTTSGYVTQMAQHFTNPYPLSMLSEINICKTGDNAKFRIRVYNMDSITKSPSLDLLDTVIEVTSKGRHVGIDVEKYQIFIIEKDFFIAVEWLKIPFNERKSDYKLNGEKKQLIQYSPFLSFKRKNDGEKNFNNISETWQKTYTGRWMRTDGIAKLFLISAKVKY